MNSCSISVGLLFLCFFITFSYWRNNQADFTGDVSIKCGSSGASAARNGQQWLGDVRSKLSPLLQVRGSSAASTAISQLSSADPVPHKTARNSRSQFSYAFQLKAGFEIVKLSNPDDSLASPNPMPPPQIPRSLRIQNLLGSQNARATIAIAAISLLSIILHKLWEILGARSSDEEEQKPSGKAERHGRRFSLAEIESATRNFNDRLLIGRGGFGNVYKGRIDNGEKIVAVKRLRWDAKQGEREFLTEIETLSQLRDINIVSLIGYCCEQGEMILVYEYMACGTLADHLYKLGRNNSNSSSRNWKQRLSIRIGAARGLYLYKRGRNNSNSSSLNWKQRLSICIGAARGLDYLHTGHGVIHRDVKASNILLDENFIAKVSDFGLAKTEDRNKLQSHVSTQVKGTWGYWDPHYIKTGKLTRKSDIYSFGVVLLEVLCGREALVKGVLEEERLLSSWAVDKINKGEVDQIVDSNLREEISPNSLKTFVEVAKTCLDDEPKRRPTMSKVVLRLEFALKQQDRPL